MIVVTAATGQLGRLVVEQLLAKVPAAQIVAAVRDPARAQSLAQKGVIVRQADYSQPETLKAAFEGAEKVLLVSGTEVGGRVQQHQSVVEAARSADVSLLAYTSTLKADTATTILAKDHQATEAYIRSSGVPYTFLRNGFYVEMRTMSLAAAIEHGVMLGAAKDGRFAAATREDYAAAAVAALTGDGHENKVYELGGDASWTLAEFAAEVARQANSPVIYNDLAPAEYSKILASFGIPEGLALAIADADRGASLGELDTAARDLSNLIGHATTPVRLSIAAALSR